MTNAFPKKKLEAPLRKYILAWTFWPLEQSCLASWKTSVWWKRNPPVLDTAARLHDLQLCSNVSNAALHDCIEVHHWSLSNQLLQTKPMSEEKLLISNLWTYSSAFINENLYWTYLRNQNGYNLSCTEEFQEMWTKTDHVWYQYRRNWQLSIRKNALATLWLSEVQSTSWRPIVDLNSYQDSCLETSLQMWEHLGNVVESRHSLFTVFEQ